MLNCYVSKEATVDRLYEAINSVVRRETTPSYEGVEKPFWIQRSMRLQAARDVHEIPRRLFKKAVQQGRSERRGEAYSSPYGEPLSDARTKLAAFFNSLLGVQNVETQLPDGEPPHDYAIESGASVPLSGYGRRRQLRRGALHHPNRALPCI